jgi:uncharacterized protein (TIGR03085 family)
VATPNQARVQRAEFCDTLLALGPDQPTLCDGWTTRDLAAHIVVRERRPDAAAGIMLRFLAGHNARVQAALARSKPFEEIIELVRRPPVWTMSGIPPLDRLVNTLELFIHTEDARRAQPDWAPRPLPADLAAQLWRQVRAGARFSGALRKFPAAVVLEAPGHGEVRTGAAPDPAVRVTADPGELALFLSGRQRASRVDLTGPEPVVNALRTLKLGN